MIMDFSKVQIFVRPGITDMRKQINGLSVLAEDEMGKDSGSGSLFLFCSRNKKTLNVSTGIVMDFVCGRKNLKKIDSLGL